METDRRVQDFETLQAYVAQSRHLNLQDFAAAELEQAILERLSELGAATCSEYIDRLQVDPQEYARLLDRILLPKSVIQNDSELFDLLTTTVFPTLENRPIENMRIWCVGCGTGEEAYSLAIALAERFGLVAVQQKVKIFATDDDDAALNIARPATYSAGSLEGLSSDLLSKYFTAGTGNFTFKNDLRRSVIFGRHELTNDAPISRMDLIICRGKLPFLNPDQQKKALARIKFALQSSAFLIVGKGEEIVDEPQLSKLRSRIYSKVQTNLVERDESAYAHPAEQVDETVRLQEGSFESGRVAQLIIDATGVMVGANRKARSTFGIAVQDLGRLVQDLEISYRPLELRSLIQQAIASRHSLIQPSTPRHLHNGRVQYFDVHVHPLCDDQHEIIGVTLQFDDVTEYQNLHEELTSLNQQLQTANEELQSTHEELETTNEELQSTNEELETINEELQSSNEELETMNDELQCTNTQLETGNTQQRELTTRINRSNIFLESILASIRSGVIVVDEQFKVMIWNERSADMWGLRADEVKGQSLFSLDIGLPINDFQSQLRQFPNGQDGYLEFETDAINRRGRSIKCKLRATPMVAQSRKGTVLLIEQVSP
jgi:two-component system CheB/CheR fusion protein